MINSLDIIKKSVVSTGDITKIKRVMNKVQNREPVTIGFIGGSITQGACASNIDKRYANLVHKWWETKFPDTEIKCINAGIGATGSLLGCHRVYEHLLKYNPDFVIVEYAVNDTAEPIIEQTYEGVIRQVLTAKNNPGLMLVFLMNNQGQNVQDLHKKIGFHYNLPMVSYRDALWPEIVAGHIKWTDISPDEIHPNDLGHDFISRIITSQLEQIYDCTIETIPQLLPKPLISDLYTNTMILYSDKFKPVSYGDWEEGNTLIFSPGWVAKNKTYEPMIFELEAKSIGIIYKKYNVEMGRAEVQVDNLKPILLEGHFPCYWGGYACGEIIAADLQPGKHTLKVKKFEHPHPESTGNEFEISGILIAK